MLYFVSAALNVGNFHVELKGLSRQRIIEIEHHGFVLHFVNPHGDGLPLWALGHRHGAASGGIFS